MPGTSKMSLETYIASTPNNPVTVKSDTLVLIPSRKEKKHDFLPLSSGSGHFIQVLDAGISSSNVQWEPSCFRYTLEVRQSP